ncbi:MAG: hypothetical protein KDC12_00285 [Flavobacteriales bacterium]|nr:hypothetical protein [Flavobacteriales bacterium]
MKLKLLLFINALFIFSIAGAQNYGETEEQQEKCKEALSLYRTYRDQEQFDDAYRFWQRACDDCPRDVTERLYTDGVKFLGYKIDQAEGTDREAVLVDSLLMFYDLRAEYYPGNDEVPPGHCDVLGMKAISLLKYRPDELDSAYAWLDETINCMQDYSRAVYLSNYYLVKYKVMAKSDDDVKNKMKKELLLDYLNLQDWCDQAMARETKERTIESYQKAKNNIDEIFVVLAECDKMLPILEDKVNESPDDIDVLKKVLRLMNKKDCTDSAFYLEVAEKVCAAEESSACNYAIGIGYAKKEDMNKALTYLEKAVDLCPDCADRETYLLKAGQVASVLKQARKARGYANDVLAMNPNSGEAWMLHGDAIAASSSMCDDGKLGSVSVYWLAVDKYAKAKSLDPSLADAANKKISRCASQYPDRATLFGYTLKDGDSFTVTCWGETTTIRERK